MDKWFFDLNAGCELIADHGADNGLSSMFCMALPAPQLGVDDLPLGAAVCLWVTTGITGVGSD